MTEEKKPRVKIVAPSRALTDVHDLSTIDYARLDKAEAALEALGWEVSEAPNVRKMYKRFAGTDEERAEALVDALTDPENDLALVVRGGYGATRLLHLIDWEKLKGKVCVPLAGFSDVTALHMALYMKLGRGSWQTPSLSVFSHKSQKRDDSFQGAFRDKHYALEYMIKGKSFETEDIFFTRGTLWGGNLTMLSVMLGTPYFPTIENGILFLEDTDEPAYSIERMLLHLALAGVLQKQKLILLGAFTGAEKNEGSGDGRFTIKDVRNYIYEKLDVPVISGLPFGHTTESVSLPVGVPATFELQGEKAILHANVESVLPRRAPGR